MPALDSCYLSIPVPADRVVDLRTIQARFTPHREAMRLQNAATAHVTLRYFGALTEEDQAVVRAHMEEAVRDMQPFVIPVGAMRILGSAHRPRVVILSVEAVPELLSLRDAAHRIPIGKPDVQPYLPHLTVARVVGRLAKDALVPLLDDTRFGPFHATAVQFSAMDPDSLAKQTTMWMLPLEA